jgi:hypothetical protein
LISESRILENSLISDDIELSVDVNPCDQMVQNVENQNHIVMKGNSEQKLVAEEDSCMEIPDSDGENMPEMNYDFNTNKPME